MPFHSVKYQSLESQLKFFIWQFNGKVWKWAKVEVPYTVWAQDLSRQRKSVWRFLHYSTVKIMPDWIYLKKTNHVYNRAANKFFSVFIRWHMYFSFILFLGNPLDFLQNQPQFQQMRQIIQQNPSLLPALLQQIGRENPSLLQVPSLSQNCTSTCVGYNDWRCIYFTCWHPTMLPALSSKSLETAALKKGIL